jgi:hypothetical protein
MRIKQKNTAKHPSQNITRLDTLKQINRNAAGIDVGKTVECTLLFLRAAMDGFFASSEIELPTKCPGMKKLLTSISACARALESLLEIWSRGLAMKT